MHFRRSAATPTVGQLKTLISSLLAENPTPEVIRDYVYLCRNMAAAYLRVKVSRGRLDPTLFGVSLDDLALDCVADLFERDHVGQFPEVKSYYDSLPAADPTEEMLFGATRRLIFSKVNERLFELYREHDRSLSKVIRNIKIGLRTHRKLFMFEKNNEVWVGTADSLRRAESLPLPPSEIVEARLFAEVHTFWNVRNLLDAFGGFLDTQDLYRKQYPLVGLALIFRSLLQRTDVVNGAVAIDPDGLTTDEIQEFLLASLEHVHNSMRPSYVGKGKLDEHMYDIYFNSIRDILESEFIKNDGNRNSYFEVLKARMATLDEAEYMKNHRTYLEYLAKLVRKEFLESVSHELKFATKP